MAGRWFSRNANRRAWERVVDGLTEEITTAYAGLSGNPITIAHQRGSDAYYRELQGLIKNCRNIIGWGKPSDAKRATHFAAIEAATPRLSAAVSYLRQAEAVSPEALIQEAITHFDNASLGYSVDDVTSARILDCRGHNVAPAANALVLLTPENSPGGFVVETNKEAQALKQAGAHIIVSSIEEQRDQVPGISDEEAFEAAKQQAEEELKRLLADQNLSDKILEIFVVPLTERALLEMIEPIGVSAANPEELGNGIGKIAEYLGLA